MSSPPSATPSAPTADAPIARDDEHPRAIRSYVLRQGRMSNAQKRAYDTLRSQFAVDLAQHPPDWSQIFGRSAPLVLEIGFGMGETTAHVAQADPARNYLGVEVHLPGVGSLLKLIGEHQLSNVRIVQYDAVEVVRRMIAPAALAGIHIYFPDPWPKTRHHKRRLIQPAFVQLLASRLTVGGYLHVATDWQEYAEQVLAVLHEEPLLENTVADFAPRPDYRPLTKFEQRGLRLGHGVWDIVFRRSDAPA